MRPRSIRARLTLWYTGLLTITLLLLGGVAYRLMVSSLDQEVDTALRKISDVLSAQARREVASFFPTNIDNVFRQHFGVSPLDRYFQMLDAQGQRDPRLPRPSKKKLPFSPQAQANAKLGRQTYETIENVADYPIRLLTLPVIENNRLINVVQVGLSLKNSYETRRRFVHMMAIVLPIALILASGGGWLLAHRALSPVDQMTIAAQRIGAERLAQRLEESGTGDELDRLATTLNAMLSRLDDAFRQIRQFSADASHELQTPLTILKGELEVALLSPRSPEAYQHTLHSALEEVDRIAILVDGLMLLARADAGVLRMDYQPIELHQLVHDVYHQTKVLADAKPLKFDLKTVEPVVIQGDNDRLRRLLLNLVDNGIKYTPADGQITLSLQRQHEWAVLTVADTGMGLSADEQEHIFQRFYRTDGARSQLATGSGLGLCIAQSIATAHGGRIDLSSLPGQGSAFTIYLPLTA